MHLNFYLSYFEFKKIGYLSTVSHYTHDRCYRIIVSYNTKLIYHRGIDRASSDVDTTIGHMIDLV